MLEYELDIAQRLLDKSEDVVFVRCRGGKSYCTANNPNPGQAFSEVKCFECKSRAKSGLEWLQTSGSRLLDAPFLGPTKAQQERILEVLALFDSDYCALVKPPSELSDLEKVCWFASISSLKSDLRDAKPSLKDFKLDMRLRLIDALEGMYSAGQLIEKYSPEKIMVYNGRMGRWASILTLARQAGIPCQIYEYPRYELTKYLVLDGFLPQDEEKIWRFAGEKFEAESTKTKMELLRRASAWFEARRNFEVDGAQSRFLGKRLGMMEEGKNISLEGSNQKHVAVFLSSQFEQNPFPNKRLRPDQVKFVRAAAKALPEVLFIVRVHPVQPVSDRRFLQEVFSLSQLSNCRLIGPDENVDSFVLGAACDVSVTFGSTIGLELAYQGTQVIECGGPSYAAFGAALYVRTSAELVTCISSCLSLGSGIAEAEGKKSALKALAAQINFGEEGEYLSLGSGGEILMVRGENLYRIEPSLIVRLVTRLLARWAKVVRLLRQKAHQDFWIPRRLNG